MITLNVHHLADRHLRNHIQGFEKITRYIFASTGWGNTRAQGNFNLKLKAKNLIFHKINIEISTGNFSVFHYVVGVKRRGEGAANRITIDLMGLAYRRKKAADRVKMSGINISCSVQLFKEYR
ncbi:hypothetical protein AAGR08_22875 (plasmid) [Pantoea sp. BRR-3P]|uniref:hypothetical protein n=1 Tax=Pantoea sp. BRR-3P TaxID=3141541 RepID=UPI0031F57713